MKNHSLILTFLGLALLASCAAKKTLSKSSQSEAYTYDLSENGCETGKHTFSSKDGYCKGLKNEELNHYCAASLRQETYESQGCPGSFFD